MKIRTCPTRYLFIQLFIILGIFPDSFLQNITVLRKHFGIFNAFFITEFFFFLSCWVECVISSSVTETTAVQ